MVLQIRVENWSVLEYTQKMVYRLLDRPFSCKGSNRDTYMYVIYNIIVFAQSMENEGLYEESNFIHKWIKCW